MQQVLCFGDSNTWGYNPENGERFPWGIRWTSILQQKLANKDIRIIEEGLCGRTTVFEDPLRQGRKGVSLFPTLLETHKPENIVIMLGTNDCKTVFSASPESVEVSRKLTDVYRNIADEFGVEFLAASSMADSSEADQEHMNPEGHAALAGAIEEKIYQMAC